MPWFHVQDSVESDEENSKQKESSRSEFNYRILKKLELVFLLNESLLDFHELIFGLNYEITWGNCGGWKCLFPIIAMAYICKDNIDCKTLI